MVFSKKLVYSMLLVMCTSLLAVCYSVVASPTQEDDEKRALEAAHKRLVEVFDKTDGMFYKARKNDKGATLYGVKWEYEGEVSQITLVLERQGTYSGEPVFAVFAYCWVIEKEKTLPPAVIKKVPISSDNGLLASFCMSKELNEIYVKGSIPSDTLTSGQLWMLCTHVHIARVRLKKEVDQILSDASK